MRKIQKVAVLILALAMMLSSGLQSALAGETLQVQVKAEFQYSEARKMLKLVNKFRTGKKAWYWDEDNKKKIKVKDLKQLEYDYDLERTAMQRAVEIAAYFAHTRPDGSSWSTAFPSSVKTRGENICYGYGSADAAFNAFAEEDKNYAGQGHRRNMLRKEFTRVGFGCVRVGNMVYWAQAFGAGGNGGSDSNKFKTSQVNVSPELMVKTARSVMPEDESLTINIGETITMPNAVITSNTGARLMLTDRTWKPKDAIITVSGKKLTGTDVGQTKLETTIGGKTLQLPVSVVASGAGGEDDGDGDDLLALIDDYDPALGMEYLILLEDDECFEFE